MIPAVLTRLSLYRLRPLGYGGQVIPPSLRANPAKQSIAPSKERMDCFVARAPRNDGGEPCIQFSDLSQGVNPRSRGAMRPRLAFISRPRKQRAQGKPGARRTRGLVCKLHKKCAHESRVAEASCRAGKRGAGTLCCIRQLWHDEATHNYGGGDANGNAAFRPRLPLNLASLRSQQDGLSSSRNPSSQLQAMGIASLDPSSEPTHSGYPKIVFSNLGNRALMSASRTTLRCATPFFVVWIRPASRRTRKWFDSVDLAMPGHGVASVQDMQSFFCSSRLLTIRRRIGSANVMSSRDG